MTPCSMALISDWSINSFVMMVYENIISRTLDKKFWLNFKKFSQTTIIKLFEDLSEMSVLPAGGLIDRPIFTDRKGK